MSSPETLRPIGNAGADLAAEIDTLGQRLAAVRERIGRVIFGQREVIDQALITLLAGGHALLIGVPGLAKTRLVETLGTVLGLDALSTDPRFLRNADRIANRETLTQLLEEQTKQRSRAELLRALEKVGVPAGPIAVMERTTDPV